MLVSYSLLKKPRFHIFIFLAVFSLAGNPANARMGNICDHAAGLAAQQTNVPLSILKAVTRTETGRNQNGKLEPWPWAINAEGKGSWFDTRAAALNHAQSRISGGRTNIDIGCFQLNYRWHGEAFTSLSEMFDPIKNALYAAQFLSQLHKEKGDWMRAVGAYHSRTREHATRYKKRFSEIHANLPGGNQFASGTVPPERRTNGFPLLQHSNARPRLGSLVPLGNGTARSLLAPSDGEI